MKRPFATGFMLLQLLDYIFNMAICCNHDWEAAETRKIVAEVDIDKNLKDIKFLKIILYHLSWR